MGEDILNGETAAPADHLRFALLERTCGQAGDWSLVHDFESAVEAVSCVFNLDMRTSRRTQAVVDGNPGEWWVPVPEFIGAGEGTFLDELTGYRARLTGRQTAG